MRLNEKILKDPNLRPTLKKVILGTANILQNIISPQFNKDFYETLLFFHLDIAVTIVVLAEMAKKKNVNPLVTPGQLLKIIYKNREMLRKYILKLTTEIKEEQPISVPYKEMAFISRRVGTDFGLPKNGAKP
jgi:hypothetical protein